MEKELESLENPGERKTEKTRVRLAGRVGFLLDIPHDQFKAVFEEAISNNRMILVTNKAQKRYAFNPHQVTVAKQI
jgi:hypothetical protein